MNLIRNVIGLWICLIMLNVALLAFCFAANINFDYDSINDDIAINQLRRIMLISYDIKASDKSLDFIYHNKDFSLSLVNNKLILQPGTQIFINNIDDVCFEVKNNCYMIVYYRGGKEYEKAICPQRGIYIDDFSDCDVLYDEYNSDED